MSFARLNGRRHRRTRRGCSRRRVAALSETGARSPRRSACANRRDFPIARGLRACRPAQSIELRRRQPAGTTRTCRPQAAPAARARDRSSCRRPPTARRPSCSRSCRRRWRGSRSRCPAQTAGGAARSAAFRSSRTMPGSTRAQRSAAFTSSRRLKYFDVSTTSPAPMAWPACDVPPPRIVIEQRCCRQALTMRRDPRATSERRRRSAGSGRRWRRSSTARARARRTALRRRGTRELAAQRGDVDRAVIGRGDYRMLAEFADTMAVR